MMCKIVTSCPFSGSNALTAEGFRPQILDLTGKKCYADTIFFEKRCFT
jgi:hypothetical protein